MDPHAKRGKTSFTQFIVRENLLQLIPRAGNDPIQLAQNACFFFDYWKTCYITAANHVETWLVETIN